MAENKSGSFEESLKQLEAIVKELEGEGADLARSVDLFKEGRRLVQHCETLLKSAEETLKATNGVAAPERGDDAAADDDAPF